MLAERVQYIKSAYQRLQILSQDPEKRAEYEALEKGLRDYTQMMKEAWEAGRIEGEARGFAKGLAMAEARGERKIILRVLETLSPEQVAAALKKPLEDIQRLMECSS